MRLVHRASLAMLLLVLIGCAGEQLPTTYSVTGKAYDMEGNPLAEGMVQFKHPSDTTLSIVGEIDKEGSFALKTLKGKWTLKGAPEGEYEVVVLPGVPKGQHAALPEITFPQSFRVEPKENTFELRPGKGR
jgi:hypothetical protein